jgi:hypothetical protein
MQILIFLPIVQAGLIQMNSISGNQEKRLTAAGHHQKPVFL